RNGPETVESGRRSFGWGYDDAIRAWRRAVRRLLCFVDNADPRQCRLVRFEDLVSDPVGEMSEIVEFLGLDVRRYPFQRIGSIPVIGSSTFGRSEGKPIHWGPVPKTGEFDPLSRARDWPRWRQKRAAWVTAAERRRLGYPVPSISARDGLLNLAMDFVH